MFQIRERIFLKNFLLLLFGTLFAQSASILVLLITARQLGSERYGQYIACITFTGLASIAVNLGAEIWLLREGRNGPRFLGEAMGGVLSIKIIVGTFWLGLMYLISLLLDPIVFPPYLFRLSAVFSWLNGIFTTVITGYKATMRNIFTLFLQSIHSIFLLGLTVILFLKNENDPGRYIYVRIIGLFLSLMIGLFLGMREIFHLRVTRSKIFQIIKELPPFAISELLAWAYMRLDVLIIAIALDQHRVGIYAVAENIVNTMFFVPSAAYETTIPFLVSIMAYNQIKFNKNIVIYLRPYIFIGLLLSFFVYLFAFILPNLLGMSFIDAIGVLLILSPIPFLHSIAFGLASILVVVGKQSERMMIQAQVVVVNIIMNILLVYKLGIYGVALVYVFTEILLVVGYVILICKCSVARTGLRM